MNNAALVGDYIPAQNGVKQPSTKAELKVVEGIDHNAEQQAKAKQQQINNKGLATLQNILLKNRHCTLSGLFESLSPNVRKAVFIAAQLTRSELNKPIHQLTGNQRHKLWIGINRINDFVEQIKKQNLFCFAAFNVGESEVHPAPTIEEMEEITRLKAERREQQNQINAEQIEQLKQATS
jgi:hypothetical protein